MLLHQGQQEGKRGQAVELDALLFQGADGFLNLLPATGQLVFHRAGRHPQGFCDLPDGHLLVVVHADGRPLTVGKTVQDLVHQPGGLLPIQVQLRRGVGRQVRLLGQAIALLVFQLRKQHRALLPQGGLGLV